MQPDLYTCVDAQTQRSEVSHNVAQVGDLHHLTLSRLFVQPCQGSRQCRLPIGGASDFDAGDWIQLRSNFISPPSLHWSLKTNEY
jgi:hypothetical protein